MRQVLKSVIRLLDDVNKEIPVNQSFLNDLIKTIEESSKQDDRKPSKTYKPSSLNCIRNMYYQLTGADLDSDEVSYMATNIANSGSDIHVRIQTAISRMKEFGIDCEYVDVAEFIRNRDLKLEVKEKSGMETKLYNPVLNMSFMTDGIIRYKNHYYVLEVKTETSYKFNQRTGVDSKHYNQAICYSLNFGLDEVIFLYINRDILSMKSYLFTVTDDMRNDVVDLILTCDHYAEFNQVPPKPEEYGSKFCQYCRYKGRCNLD